MANNLDAHEGTAQAASNDATAHKLMDEVHNEMQAFSQARKNESYLDRGIDLFYDQSDSDLKHLSALDQDLLAAAAKGDVAAIDSRHNAIEQELAADQEHLHTKETVDGVAKVVLTTAPLFIPGPVGLVGAIVISGLAQAKPADKLSTQVIDFGLGGVKGGLMKGAFALGSATELGVAGRALLLGPSQRVLETGLNRQTYQSASGHTDIVGGLKKTAEQAVNPVNLATDVATFAIAGGLATGLDKLTAGAISASPLLSTVTTGGIFGFTSGAGQEVQTELQTSGHLSLQKVALAGAESAAITAIAAVPGGLVSAHMAATAATESKSAPAENRASEDEGVSNWPEEGQQLSQPRNGTSTGADTEAGANQGAGKGAGTGAETGRGSWVQLPLPEDGQPPSIEAPGDYTQSFVSDGLMRSYEIHVPDSYDPDEPMPAVVMLHGIEQDGESFADRTQMNAKADQEGFIAVYPEGNQIGTSPAHRVWNVPNWELFHPANGTDDVGFVGQVINSVQSQLAVDPDRTYIAGFSNGGMLAQAVAANDGNKIAALALVGAALSGKDSAPTNPMSVLDIHGTSDPVVPYEGRKYTFGLVDMKPASTTLNYWLQADGIDAPTVMEKNGPVYTTDGESPDSGLEVKQITIKGGMHGWPRPSSPDAADRSISATDEIWDFFSRHTLLH